MNITKFGHSCLLIEDGGARILVDPGVWSSNHTELEGIDAIFLTHEHPDHADPASLVSLRERNPDVIIYTNEGVGAVLDKAGIPWQRFVDGEAMRVKELTIEAYGRDHAVIYPSLPVVRNTSFLIAGRLLVTGDAFFRPPKPVEILALPVCAPWMRLAEAIDFAKIIKPTVSFPVHDAMLKHTGPFHRLPAMILEPETVEWKVLTDGTAYAF